MSSVNPDILPLDRIWKYERRTRTYRNLYVHMKERLALGTLEKDDINFDMTERMLKKHKTHRNIVDIERSYLSNS